MDISAVGVFLCFAGYERCHPMDEAMVIEEIREFLEPVFEAIVKEDEW